MERKFCSQECFFAHQPIIYNEEVRKKMSDIKKQQYKDGLKVWNEGKHVKSNDALDKWRKEGGIPWNKDKGCKTPLVNKVRSRIEYRNWRTDIMQRDDYVCQICSTRGGKLQVDHFPKPFATIMLNIKTMEEALGCGELWDRDNGRTLCIDCHKKHGIKPKPKEH